MFRLFKTLQKKIMTLQATGLILACCILATSFSSSARDVWLTAEFKPDITQPQKKEFTNTTPQGGVCIWYPSLCSGPGMFSIVIPGHFGYKMFNPKTTDHLKEGLGYRIDSRTKNIRLTDSKTNKTIDVSFRLNLIGIKYRKSVTGGQWFDIITLNQTIKGNCTHLNRTAGQTDVDWTTGLPYAIADCRGGIHPNATWSGEIGIPILSFGYSLSTPNPLNISSGVYEGEVVYNVNNGADNNGMQFGTERNDHDIVRFKIKATVEHAFFYRFPTGSETVRLTPREGWSRWINGGEVPDSLSKEVPFTLTTSQPFKVKMLCQYKAGQGCALKKNGGSEEVPLELRATLPGLKTLTGAEVNNLALNNSPEGIKLTNDGYYIANRRSALDFRVKRQGVEMMVKEPGSVWKGNVTLVFDTEI